MKLKATLLSIIGITATSLVALAEPNAATNNSTNASSDVSTNIAANTSATAAAPVPAETNSAPAEANPIPAGAAAPALATAADTSSSVTTASTNNAPHDPNAVIPVIIMDDVPLTDAIKNLARQAGLNYMLDPKINYGAPDASGRVPQQPMVSLRWENLTADQALTAVLNNYNLTIIDDPKTHIARITVKDPAAPDPLVTKIIQLKYADPTNIVQNVQNVLQDKRSKVAGDIRTAQLVVLATDKELIAIDELITRLDTQTKQVLIEARLVETTKNPSTAKGIDWSGTFGAQNIRFGNNALVGSPFVRGTPAVPGVPATPGVPGVPAKPAVPDQQELPSRILDPRTMLTANTANGFFPGTFFLNADGASAVLSFLNKDADAQILSTPRAVTLDNETAILSVTRAQPIFKTTAGTQGSPGGSEVTYTNLGTILKVTPRISANNTISLKVIPEVSSLAGVSSKIVAGLVNEADIYDVRHIETQVLIPSGNTLVMGGLVSDDRTKGNIKVPLLGDIPLLGSLFRQQSKSQLKRNLIIFITPTIVQPEDYQPTQTEFLKNKLPNENATDFGAWDSGKPQDWSKLMKKPKKGEEDDSNFIK